MKIVLIGAGQRGRVYADYMMEKGCAQIVAIVEPNDVRRKEAAAQLGVAADWCFTDGSGSLHAGDESTGTGLPRPAGKAHFPESRRVHGHPAPRRREETACGGLPCPALHAVLLPDQGNH